MCENPGRMRIPGNGVWTLTATPSPPESQPSVTVQDFQLAPVERRPPVRPNSRHGPGAAPAHLLPVAVLWLGNRNQQAVIDYLLEENRILRAVSGSRRLRLTDAQRRRLAVKGKVLGRRQLAAVAGIVTPDTILRWYRRLVAKMYYGSQPRRPGRPSTKPDIAALVVRMATENPTWGYTRIRGGLKHIGHDVARNTIKAILKDHGIEPVPSPVIVNTSTVKKSAAASPSQ